MFREGSASVEASERKVYAITPRPASQQFSRAKQLTNLPEQVVKPKSEEDKDRILKKRKGKGGKGKGKKKGEGKGKGKVKRKGSD